jgi:2-aminoadipate transaminase
VERFLLDEARRALDSPPTRPVYVRLAEALGDVLSGSPDVKVPSARALAGRLGINRATATAAYRELARRGLIELRRGRPRAAGAQPQRRSSASASPPDGALDLARYAPDRELLPGGRVFDWLGLGEGEGEAVVQYGDPRGFEPLRRLLLRRLTAVGAHFDEERLVLTSGVQHGLDLLMRALLQPGDGVLVEDPTYPGLPPLLAVHRVRPHSLPVHLDGVHPEDVRGAVTGARPRLAILTPTLHNPTGTVMDLAARQTVLAALTGGGVQVVEEFFDPGLVSEGQPVPSLAALDPNVVLVGSFSKALFPGLRVGWLAGPRQVVERVSNVKQATDLSGSTFLEAAAYQLCRRGVLDRQLSRLRQAARERSRIVLAGLEAAPPGVQWTRPRGGFSLLVALPQGVGSEGVAARAAARGVWVLPGPTMSVSGRDDVVRLAYAAVGGEILAGAVERFAAVLRPRRAGVALV